jgi:hypothetical protein
LLQSIVAKHHPELGSTQGLSEYDALVEQSALADEDEARQYTVQVLTKLKTAFAKEPQKRSGRTCRSSFARSKSISS